jgi:hypothetical protein
MLDAQLVHPGIWHSDQLTNAVGMKLLEVHYPSEFMHRQSTRFFSNDGAGLLAREGGDLQASINFIIAGPGWEKVVRNHTAVRQLLQRTKRPSHSLDHLGARHTCTLPICSQPGKRAICVM